MIFKKMIELFLPKILNFGYLKYFSNLYFCRIYYGLIKGKKVKKKINFNWSKIDCNRIRLVNLFLHKAIISNPDCKYLEIGCANNKVFNSVIIKNENKFGVDPEKGGNLRMTSNEFFKNNKEKFDVIFIDGLHEYEQCQMDAINAIKSIKKGGVILFHDFIPTDWEKEHVPRFTEGWNGDVWKVAYELSNSINCDFKVVECDAGIGFLQVYDNFKYIKQNEKLKNLSFKNFLELKDKIKFIDPKSFLEKYS